MILDENLAHFFGIRPRPVDDIVYGTDDPDELAGRDGNDSLFGEDGSDRLYGGSGNDHLEGADQSDRIYGGAGNDRIAGGDDEGDGPIIVAGNRLTEFNAPDILTGGDGRDTFVFDGDDDDHDLITDFQRGRDRLEISDVGPGDITQISIKSGIYGKGLLILTNGDNGLFLEDVRGTLHIGTDIVFV